MHIRELPQYLHRKPHIRQFVLLGKLDFPLDYWTENGEG